MIGERITHADFTVERGCPVHSMKTGWGVQGRRQVVKNAEIADYGERYRVVTWPGGGGYWRRVHIFDGEPIDHYPDWDAIRLEEREAQYRGMQGSA